MARQHRGILRDKVGDKEKERDDWLKRSEKKCYRKSRSDIRKCSFSIAFVEDLASN